jgi:hypothetical protein
MRLSEFWTMLNNDRRGIGLKIILLALLMLIAALLEPR